MSSKFKIRDPLGGENELSSREILRRISSGKYKGDEKIAECGSSRWQKISSHPKFYDAFIRRLFHDKYPIESSLERTNRTKRTAMGRERHTQKVVPADSHSDPDGLPESGREPGTIVAQQDIDALFDEGASPNASQGVGIKTTVEVLIDDANEVKVPPSNQPLPLYPGMEEYQFELENTQKRNERRRILVWAGILVGVLWLLFQMGDDNSTRLATDPGIRGEEALEQFVRLGLGDSEERLRTISEEGDRYFENDSWLYYVRALEAYREVRAADGRKATWAAKVALTAMRLLEEVPENVVLENEARLAIEQGRVLDPQWEAFYRAEAGIALYKKDLVQAEISISSALLVDPGGNENKLILAEFQILKGKGNEAYSTLTELARVYPTSVRTRYLLAVVSYHRRDFAQAKRHALKSLSLNPFHLKSLLLLGDISSVTNDLKAAIQWYQKCARYSPMSSPKLAARTYLRLGQLMEITGRKEEAKKYFSLSVWMSPESQSGDIKGHGKESFNEAKFKQWISEIQITSDDLMSEARELSRQKKYLDAILFYQAAALINPKSGETLVRMGEEAEKVAVSYDEFRRIMNLYRRAIERNPSDPSGYIRLGLLETAQYNLERGYLLLQQAATLDPKRADAFVALGKHYFKRQDYREALAQFSKAYEFRPTEPEILFYFGKIRQVYKRESAKDSMDFFYRAYMLDPSYYEALAEWLKLKTLNFERTFSLKFLNNLIDEDPGNGNLYWVRGEVFAVNKEFQRAIASYHAALDKDNRSSKVRFALAKALEAVGDSDKAVAEYRLSSLLDRRNSEGFFRAAELLFQSRKYPQAEEALKFLIEVCPNYPGANRYLSQIYFLKNERELAIKAMKEEVTKNPLNIKFRTDLAELYMEYNRIDEAISQLSEITNLPPVSKAPEYLYDKIRGYLLLSKCYRAQGKNESAEGAIRLAMEIDPNDPLLHRELGYVYHALQRDQESVKELEIYLNRNPAAQDADSVKQLIQRMRIDD